MMTKEKSTVYQNYTFHDPRGWGMMLGRGHIGHNSEYLLFSTLSIYSTLIAIVLRGYNAAFLYNR